MTTGSPWVILLGRVLMSFIFIHGGINKAMAPAATMAYFAKLSLPMPGAAYALTLLVEIGAGIAFLIGWKAKWSALVLAIWCVATAFAAHYHPDDAGQMIHFMKNMCMAGGFLQVVAFGAGRFSVDRR
jgi:putative oxidoreductase